METICSSHFPIYRDLPLYEVHQIGRAATGEPTLLEQGRFGECPSTHLFAHLDCGTENSGLQPAIPARFQVACKCDCDCDCDILLWIFLIRLNCYQIICFTNIISNPGGDCYSLSAPNFFYRDKTFCL